MAGYRHRTRPHGIGRSPISVSPSAVSNRQDKNQDRDLKPLINAEHKGTKHKYSQLTEIQPITKNNFLFSKISHEYPAQNTLNQAYYIQNMPFFLLPFVIVCLLLQAGK